MIILGLNAFHGDSAACILVDGKLKAAVEEERFRRLKHWAGFPSEAIRYCLDEVGAKLGDVDVVALNQNSRAHLWKKIGYTISQRPSPALIVNRLRNRGKRRSTAELLADAFPGERFEGRVEYVEHHLAHMSSAYHVSPFDRASIVSVDGFGDFSSGTWGLGEGDAIDVEGRVYFPHSLGIFYQALTQFLGFPHYGDEYKVMGLAPYGEPTELEKMREIVHLKPDGGYKLNLRYFRHHKDDVSMTWEDGQPEFGSLFSSELEELLGPKRERGDDLTARHHNIARSVQAMYEEAFFHLLDRLHERHGSANLAIAGGCGANSVANGKVCRKTAFENVYVQSAAGDAGGALGAAYMAWQKSGGACDFVMDHAFWGPGSGEREIADLLDGNREALAEAGCSVDKITEEDALLSQVADAISKGLVVGWYQGRSEWGPRALGNRSILGDPRRADMKDILNRKIKRRESFRPFAPSILKRATSEWFEEDGDVPFMMKVFQIREEKREQIPAVTHVDGSGRLQTVRPEANPLYHRLIEAFEERTGVPMVLNTSFNENEPVVCKPGEALACFLRTNMDLLVLGNVVIRRGQSRSEEQDPAGQQERVPAK